MSGAGAFFLDSSCSTNGDVKNTVGSWISAIFTGLQTCFLVIFGGLLTFLTSFHSEVRICTFFLIAAETQLHHKLCTYICLNSYNNELKTHMICGT